MQIIIIQLLIKSSSTHSAFTSMASKKMCTQYMQFLSHPTIFQTYFTHFYHYTQFQFSFLRFRLIYFSIQRVFIFHFDFGHGRKKRQRPILLVFYCKHNHANANTIPATISNGQKVFYQHHHCQSKVNVIVASTHAHNVNANVNGIT